MANYLYNYVSLLYSQLSGSANPVPEFVNMSSYYSMRQAIHSFIPAALIASTTVLGGTPASCPNPQLSCQNTTAVEDTCCFNAPGGQMLLTQFWDTNPPTGPNNSWTVHGLW